MPYTYILDDSIKLSPALILKADHSTPVSPRFVLQNKMWVNLYMITDTYLHDPPLLMAHFSRPLPFLQSQKVVTLPLPPPPLPPANF